MILFILENVFIMYHKNKYFKFKLKKNIKK